jgi:hypothetical protein
LKEAPWSLSTQKEHGAYKMFALLRKPRGFVSVMPAIPA